MMLGYENPVNDFQIGDVVRFASSKIEWTITGKGATTGLTLRRGQGRNRYAHTFEVTLVRRAEVSS